MRRHGAALLRRVTATTGAIVLIGACTASPQASATPTPTAAVSTPARQPTRTPAPTTPAATPTPTPGPTATSLSSVGRAPDGPWTSLRWAKLDGFPLGPHDVRVSGWSGGYVAFEQWGGADENGNVTPIVIRSTASRDGIHWTDPLTLDTSGLADLIEIEDVANGPAGLLAIAYPYGDTCGGPEPIVALWWSSDGASWERLALPKAFRTGEALSISAGAGGYLAIGTTGDAARPAVWTSEDGRGWQARPLPTVSDGEFVLDDGVAFSDGFVLVGSVRGAGGCGGPAHLRTGAWWSADGAGWTRATLPGASTNARAGLSVQAITDGSLLAVQSLPEGSSRGWTSTDGRTWSRVAHVPDEATLGAPSDGRHEVLTMEPDSGVGPISVTEVNPDASVTTLPASGDGPQASEDGPGWTIATGPTGLLVVASDGSGSWLGVPS